MATIRQITMYKDVGFDLTHKHCLDFENSNQRDAYFDGLTEKTSYADCNYNKADRTLNLECDWETGLTYTYCTFMYGDKKMFYFVTGCRVVNDKVTGFELQLDVWQTFLFEFTISEGMITREHVDRWDRDGKVLWRKAVIEDKISNYDTTITSEIKKEPFYTDNDNQVKYFMGGVFITFIKNTGSATNYATIFIPVITCEDISNQNRNLKVGNIGVDYHQDEQQIAGVLVSPTDVLSGNTFQIISVDPNSVISITYVPTISITLVSGLNIVSTVTTNVCNLTFHNYTTSRIFVEYPEMIKPDQSLQPVYCMNSLITSLSSNNDLNPNIKFKVDNTYNISISRPIKPQNNDNYSETHEPELYKAPYIIRSLIDSNGSLISEIPDVCWFDERKLTFFNINDNDKFDVGYLFQISSDENYIKAIDLDKLSNLGLFFRISGMALDIPSDIWKSYVISSKDTDREMLQSTINQQAITSSIGAIVGMGGISGMAGSGKGSGLGFNPAQAVAGASIGAVMGLAGWVANNHFGWEQQEIKEKAIRNQPNNLLRTSTGDGILKNIYTKHSYNELKCNESAFKQASKRYHRYGYRVDMMGVPNVRTRKFFNFIQTSQVRIEGALNQAIKDGVADILNNGVTIWHGEHITKDNKGKFVLDYSKENIERSLL